MNMTALYTKSSQTKNILFTSINKRFSMLMNLIMIKTRTNAFAMRKAKRNTVYTRREGLMQLTRTLRTRRLLRRSRNKLRL